MESNSYSLGHMFPVEQNHAERSYLGAQYNGSSHTSAA